MLDALAKKDTQKCLFCKLCVYFFSLAQQVLCISLYSDEVSTERDFQERLVAEEFSH